MNTIRLDLTRPALIEAIEANATEFLLALGRVAVEKNAMNPPSSGSSEERPLPIITVSSGLISPQTASTRPFWLPSSDSRLTMCLAPGMLAPPCVPRRWASDCWPTA